MGPLELGRMIGGCLMFEVATTTNALVVHKSSTTLQSFSKYLKLWNARLEEGSDAHFNDLSLSYIFDISDTKTLSISLLPLGLFPSKSSKFSFSDDDNILKYDTSFLQRG